MIEDNPYYDGFGRYELAYETPFIILIEALWYRKSLNKKYIRYNHLRKISNDSLCDITNGEKTDFGGGSFHRKIKRYELEGFFKLEKVDKKETRIYVNIPLIEKEVKRKQIENLSSRDKNLYRILKPGDTINRVLHPNVESIQVSDKVGRVVTHANPKKGSRAT